MATKCKNCGTMYNEKTIFRCVACVSEKGARRIPIKLKIPEPIKKNGVFAGRNDEALEKQRQKTGAKHRLGGGGTSAAMSSKGIVDENGRRVSKR